MCSLSWKGGLLLMVANPHCPWSLAWSQLPLCPLPSPHPGTHFMPIGHLFTFIYTHLLILAATFTLLNSSPRTMRPCPQSCWKGQLLSPCEQLASIKGISLSIPWYKSSPPSLSCSCLLKPLHSASFWTFPHFLHHSVDPVKGRYSQLKQPSPESRKHPHSTSPVQYLSIIATLRKIVMTSLSPPKIINSRETKKTNGPLTAQRGMKLIPMRSIMDLWAWACNANPHSPFPFLLMDVSSAVLARYALLVPWLSWKVADSSSCFFV